MPYEQRERGDMVLAAATLAPMAEGRCRVIPAHEVRTSGPGGKVACVDEIAFLLGHRDANLRAPRALDLADARRRSMRPSRMIASVMGPVERSADQFHSLPRLGEQDPAVVYTVVPFLPERRPRPADPRGGCPQSQCGSRSLRGFLTIPDSVRDSCFWGRSCSRFCSSGRARD